MKTSRSVGISDAKSCSFKIMLKYKFIFYVLLYLFIPAPLHAQKKQLPQTTPPLSQDNRNQPSASCDRLRAIALISDQVIEAKTLATPSQQITLTIKAADLLWTPKTEKAHALFADAYEQATDLFFKKETEPENQKRFIVSNQDLRLSVIEAVGRHDRAWAKRLAQRMTEDTARARKEGLERARDSSVESDNLLNIASSLLKTDKEGSLSLARNSLRYPPSQALIWYLYQLAAEDQNAGDQFYSEALGTYSPNASVKELLYLSAYPFGQGSMVGPEATSFGMTPPVNFKPSAVLQQQFLDSVLAKSNTLAGRAPQADETKSGSLSEAGQLELALLGLEPLAAQFQPAYSGRLGTSREALSPYLNETDHTQIEQQWQGQVQRRSETTGSLLERAEKEIDADQKDYLIASAITATGSTENFGRIETALDKVSDPKLKEQLLNWYYFTRAQNATAKGQLDEAAQFAERVEEPDFRAYLAMEIATKRLGKESGKGRAREVLEPVISLAVKGAETPAKARALFGATFLYEKIDRQRALETMIESLKTVNKIDPQEINNSYLIREIKGKRFGIYTSYDITGFTIENTFTGLDQFELDTTLNLANTLTDRFLRSSVIMAIAGQCLEKANLQQKKQELPGKVISKPVPAKTT